MLLGLYTGSELVDNKPWQMLFPIVAFVLAGSREGVLWCVAALTGAVTILFLRGSEYASLSIFIFAIAHMTTSFVVYVFMMRNEANIRTISRLSHTDPLTNTYNRQLFNELSISELNRARRAEEPLAFYMIDIDQFTARIKTEQHEDERSTQTQAHAGVLLPAAGAKLEVDGGHADEIDAAGKRQNIDANPMIGRHEHRRDAHRDHEEHLEHLTPELRNFSVPKFHYRYRFFFAWAPYSAADGREPVMPAWPLRQDWASRLPGRV